MRKMVVEANACRERVLVVALLALIAELVVVGVGGMTAHAGGRDIDAGAFHMTGLTIQVHVCTQQRKPGARGVIEYCLPALLVVAAGALLTPPTLVRIILLVTGVARGAEALHTVPVVSSLIVAGSAAETGVGTLQQKAGAGMIELCLRPQVCGVTGRAFRAERTLMHVVLLMTGSAFGGRGRKDRRVRVTGITRGFSVCAGERKAQACVLKECRLPIRTGMTRLTLHAQRVGMRIVLLVTAGALGADRGEGGVRLIVAVTTGQ